MSSASSKSSSTVSQLFKVSGSLIAPSAGLPHNTAVRPNCWRRTPSRRRVSRCLRRSRATRCFRSLRLIGSCPSWNRTPRISYRSPTLPCGCLAGGQSWSICVGKTWTCSTMPSASATARRKTMRVAGSPFRPIWWPISVLSQRTRPAFNWAKCNAFRKPPETFFGLVHKPPLSLGIRHPRSFGAFGGPPTRIDWKGFPKGIGAKAT